jgi:hypothetical protein
MAEAFLSVEFSYIKAISPKYLPGPNSSTLIPIPTCICTNPCIIKYISLAISPYFITYSFFGYITNFNFYINDPNAPISSLGNIFTLSINSLNK